jgi:predicted O-methyltransferase YrrM
MRFSIVKTMKNARFQLARAERKARMMLRGSSNTAVDALALQALAPLSSSYLPWTVMAMRPSAVATLLNDVVINRRRCIVECGGGISTVYIARLLQRIGAGHLYTVEHDAGWARLLGDALSAEGVGDRVTVLHAPLAESPYSWNGAPWYSAASLDPLTDVAPIDLLVVDGPPAHESKDPHARYPALPYFHDRLAQDFTVVLDDVRRRGELDITARWESEFGLRFERRFENGSIAIAHAGSELLV